jgi:DNA-binding LytR/AlgR family response regulator
MNPTALIAEDEPLLAEALRAELAQAWPELAVAAIAADGKLAVEHALALRPQVLFLDIRMPGLSGLEAAHAIVEDWPCEQALPLIVFVTAYDQYAMQAFEQAATDYVLKPVQTERLHKTCERLRAALAQRTGSAAGASDAALAAAMSQLHSLLGGAKPANTEPLAVIQAGGTGGAVRIVPIDDVLYFEAADKYVRVITAGDEHLIRLSLRELLPRLDAARFWQIHRGTVVRIGAVTQALRDEAGRVTLQLAERPERLSVSRLYAHRFKPQ